MTGMLARRRGVLALAAGVTVTAGIATALLSGTGSAPALGEQAAGSWAVRGRPVLAMHAAGTAVPPFRWEVRPATRALLGRSWRPGCPVPVADLRIVGLTYRHFDGSVRDGVLVLHKDVVTRARPVFAAMYATRFPLRRVRPVTDYGASDDRSMAADNTSGFNCRPAVAAGRPTWSRHAYGRAVDVNPVENPYLFRGKVLPPAGTPYADRRRHRPGMIVKGGVVHRVFTRAGFRWGGTWSSPDYQHFDR